MKAAKLGTDFVSAPDSSGHCCGHCLARVKKTLYGMRMHLYRVHGIGHRI
jgi:hypothetical protein